MSLALPEALWKHATAAQEERLERDPWDDVLADIKGEQLLHEGKEEEVVSQRRGLHGP